MPVNDYRRTILAATNTFEDGLKVLNVTGYRALLVVDEQEKLLGLVTDWDIRNALVNGVSLDATLETVMNPTPKVALAGLTSLDYKEMMLQLDIDCLPVVDSENRVVNLLLRREFVERSTLSSPIMIMAGGEGKRLWPLTLNTPKPLLPVAEKPLLEHILNHVQSQGFTNLWVSTHYKAEQIEKFVEEKAPTGLKATIIREESPLGTAGSLKTLQDDDGDKPIFIMNGDILTTLDFQAMLDWHNTHGNILTLGCRQYSFQIPYGILETDGQQVLSVHEKPRKTYNMNAGIYLVERAALKYIPDNRYFDMTDLIDALVAAEQLVGAYPISEPWIDIGKHEDYERVNRHSEEYLTKVPV